MKYYETKTRWAETRAVCNSVKQKLIGMGYPVTWRPTATGAVFACGRVEIGAVTYAFIDGNLDRRAELVAEMVAGFDSYILKNMV